MGGKSGHISKALSPTPDPRLKHRGPLEKRRCRCRLQLAAHGRGTYGPRATGHGPGYRRSRKSSSNQQRPGLLGLLACWFPCANLPGLPSGTIGDQAGTARLPGSASFLQGSTVPFPLAFPTSFLRRAYSLPHHGLEPSSIKLRFLRSVDSQHVELNHDCQSDRIECTTQSVIMNTYSNHADSDFLQGCLTT